MAKLDRATAERELRAMDRELKLLNAAVSSRYSVSSYASFAVIRLASMYSLFTPPAWDGA